MEYMEYVLKGGLTLALMFIPWMLRSLFVTTARRKKMSKQDFEFTKELFSDGNLKALHNFQLAVGFSGLTGQQTDARVVRLLFKHDDPYGLSKDYGKGRQFLEPILEGNDCKKLQLTKESQKIWIWFPRETTYSATYFVFAFIAFAPLIFVSGFAQWLGGNLVSWLLLTGLLMFSFGFISFLNLAQYSSLKAAQRVDKAFKEKDKSTSEKDSKTE